MADTFTVISLPAGVKQLQGRVMGNLLETGKVQELIVMSQEWVCGKAMLAIGSTQEGYGQ